MAKVGNARTKPTHGKGVFFFFRKFRSMEIVGVFIVVQDWRGMMMIEMY